MFKVVWSGVYPCLCHGEWTILKGEKDVSSFIPSDLRHNPMNTLKMYDSWSFGEDWSEEWDSYMTGLSFPDWIKDNPWIDNFCNSEAEKLELYEAIKEEDWQPGSCGGCI